MYNRENRERRARLKAHGRVRKRISNFWDTVLKTDSGCVPWTEYRAICYALIVLLYADNSDGLANADSEEIEQVIRENWERDVQNSNTDGVLDRYAFGEALFEATDIWSITCDVQEYDSLLKEALGTFQSIAPLVRKDAFGPENDEGLLHLSLQRIRSQGKAFKETIKRKRRQLSLPTSAVNSDDEDSEANEDASTTEHGGDNMADAGETDVSSPSSSTTTATATTSRLETLSEVSEVSSNDTKKKGNVTKTKAPAVGQAGKRSKRSREPKTIVTPAQEDANNWNNAEAPPKRKRDGHRALIKHMGAQETDVSAADQHSEQLAAGVQHEDERLRDNESSVPAEHHERGDGGFEGGRGLLQTSPANAGHSSSDKSQREDEADILDHETAMLQNKHQDFSGETGLRDIDEESGYDDEATDEEERDASHQHQLSGTYDILYAGDNDDEMSESETLSTQRDSIIGWPERLELEEEENLQFRHGEAGHVPEDESSTTVRETAFEARNEARSRPATARIHRGDTSTTHSEIDDSAFDFHIPELTDGDRLQARLRTTGSRPTMGASYVPRAEMMLNGIPEERDVDQESNCTADKRQRSSASSGQGGHGKASGEWAEDAEKNEAINIAKAGTRPSEERDGKQKIHPDGDLDHSSCQHATIYNAREQVPAFLPKLGRAKQNTYGRQPRVHKATTRAELPFKSRRNALTNYLRSILKAPSIQPSKQRTDHLGRPIYRRSSRLSKVAPLPSPSVSTVAAEGTDPGVQKVTTTASQATKQAAMPSPRYTRWSMPTEQSVSTTHQPIHSLSIVGSSMSSSKRVRS